MSYSRDLYVSTGRRFVPALLAEWSQATASAARRDIAALKPFGVTPEIFKTIDRLRAQVVRLKGAQEVGRKESRGLTIGQDKRHEAGLNWFHTARGIAELAFESDPGRFGQYRTGVRVGQSIPRLVVEVEKLVELFRRDAKLLTPFGGTPAFAKQGQAAIEDLRVSDEIQERERRTLPQATAELYAAAGELYVMTRRLIRTARVAFRLQPPKLAPYGYGMLRREKVSGRAAKTRQARREASTS